MSENFDGVELTSYDPIILELDEKAKAMERDEQIAYVRALAAIELSKRITSTMNPEVYENAAQGLKAQAEAQAKAAGTTLAKTLAEQNIPVLQYDQMVRMQAVDMVNQGLALDAWARHYKIEPTEEDVLELLNSMSDGKPEQLLQDISKDPAQLEALSLAAMRYAANKHLASKVLIAE